MNKKAAGATTAIWIVAMFILLFICIIFILDVLTIAAKQKGGDVFNDFNEINIEQKSTASDMVIQRSIENVLSEQIILEEGKISLSEAIATAEEDKIANAFKENFEKTFNELLPPRLENDYIFWWIRVYEKGEAIKAYDPDKKLQAGGQLCDPNENNFILYYFIGEKRLVTCVQKEYYEFWKEEKNE